MYTHTVSSLYKEAVSNGWIDGRALSYYPVHEGLCYGQISYRTNRERERDFGVEL